MAEVKQVKLYQNIGLLFIRFPSSVEGLLCKTCIRDYFWRMTLTSLVLGWWGIISFLTNCYFVLSNIVTCLRTIGMAEGEGEEPANYFVNHGDERLAALAGEIELGLKENEPIEALCARISDRAMVPERDVHSFIEKTFGWQCKVQ